MPIAGLGQGPPVGNMRFLVEVDGLPGGGALEVLFPEARIGASGGAGRRAEFGLLTIRRAVTASSAWYDWWDDSRTARAPAARDLIVVAIGSDGAPSHVWRYRHATPVAYALSGFHALGEGVLVESLELTVADFTAEHLAGQ